MAKLDVLELLEEHKISLIHSKVAKEWTAILSLPPPWGGSAGITISGHATTLAEALDYCIQNMNCHRPEDPLLRAYYLNKLKVTDSA